LIVNQLVLLNSYCFYLSFKSYVAYVLLDQPITIAICNLLANLLLKLYNIIGQL